MKIDLAVYTADNGFDWQPGTVYSRNELVRYKAVIGPFPNIVLEEMPYGGVFVCDGRLVFYRYHVHIKGDSRGRDAFYCVLGTLPLDMGRRIDLGKVFDTPEFAIPMRPFPLSVEVGETTFQIPFSMEELEKGIENVPSATQLGVYATFFRDGKFVCRIDKVRPRLNYNVICEGACLESGGVWRRFILMAVQKWTIIFVVLLLMLVSVLAFRSCLQQKKNSCSTPEKQVKQNGVECKWSVMSLRHCMEWFIFDDYGWAISDNAAVGPRIDRCPLEIEKHCICDDFKEAPSYE